VPALEARKDRLEKAHVQAFGLSVDSLHSHANWAVSLGGVSFPLLQDFHPKGAIASKFGLYLEKGGITDRATVMISADGVIRYLESVGPGGERDIEALVTLAEQMDKDHGGADLVEKKPRTSLGKDAVLYVKSACGFSLRALNARTNLHLDDLVVKNITENPSAKAELEQKAGKSQAPALVIGDEVLFESEDIVKRLCAHAG